MISSIPYLLNPLTLTLTFSQKGRGNKEELFLLF